MTTVSRPSDSPSSAGPALDAHLVLNGLSRIAAQYYAATKRESEEVYALSDYLARGLRASAAKAWPASREAELLEAYLELLRACKFGPMEVSVTVAAGTESALWPSHASCAMARQLLHTLQLEGDEPFSLRVRFEAQAMEWTFGATRAMAASATTAAAISKDMQALELPGLSDAACEHRAATGSASAGLSLRIRAAQD